MSNIQNPVKKTLEEIEAAIRAIPTPRLTMQYVKDRVVDVEYIYRADRATICAMRMVNGAYLTGESFAIDAVYNDKELGEQAAYSKALQKAFEFENYMQLDRFHLMREAQIQIAQHNFSEPARTVATLSEAPSPVATTTLAHSAAHDLGTDAPELQNDVHEELVVG